MTESPQPNSGPGFASHPGYKFIFSPSLKRISVFSGGVCIARSANAVVLNENTYPPVYYLPRADVQMDLMAQTDHGTYCPFKGHATYWKLAADDRRSEGVAWSYETPYDESLALKGHIAFYPDRVDEILIEDLS